MPLLGMRTISVSPERAEVVMEHQKSITMPYGMIHGGAIASLADTAAGYAMASSLTRDEAFATLEMKMNILRAVREGAVTAVATPIHRGSRTAVYDVRITDGEGRLVATFSCTQLIVKKAGWMERPPRPADDPEDGGRVAK